MRIFQVNVWDFSGDNEIDQITGTYLFREDAETEMLFVKLSGKFTGASKGFQILEFDVIE